MREMSGGEVVGKWESSCIGSHACIPNSKLIPIAASRRNERYYVWYATIDSKNQNVVMVLIRWSMSSTAGFWSAITQA